MGVHYESFGPGREAVASRIHNDGLPRHIKLSDTVEKLDIKAEMSEAVLQAVTTGVQYIRESNENTQLPHDGIISESDVRFMKRLSAEKLNSARAVTDVLDILFPLDNFSRGWFPIIKDVASGAQIQVADASSLDYRPTEYNPQINR